MTRVIFVWSIAICSINRLTMPLMWLVTVKPVGRQMLSGKGRQLCSALWWGCTAHCGEILRCGEALHCDETLHGGETLRCGETLYSALWRDTVLWWDTTLWWDTALWWETALWWDTEQLTMVRHCVLWWDTALWRDNVHCDETLCTVMRHCALLFLHCALSQPTFKVKF
jgi:hypothetical protein